MEIMLKHSVNESDRQCHLWCMVLCRGLLPGCSSEGLARIWGVLTMTGPLCWQLGYLIPRNR